MRKASNVVLATSSSLLIMLSLTQAAVGGDDGDWICSVDVLSPANPTTDKVGIGTATPENTLHVAGSDGIKVSDPEGNPDSFMTIMPNVRVDNLNPGGPQGTTDSAQITSRFLGHLVLDIRANDFQDSFAVRTDSNLDGQVDRIAVVVKPTGNVGIGTINPEGTLHVAGSDGIKVSDPEGNPDSFMTIMPSVRVDNLNPGGPQGTTGAAQITNRSLGHLVLDIRANDFQDSFAVRTDSNLDGQVDRIAVVVKPTGNVGIGTTSPQKKLDVVGVTRTEILEITGGSDLAEPFEIEGASSIEAGMVVSIDPRRVGQLRIASAAYDRTVAGIVSGADGLNPGLTMGRDTDTADGSLPVALTGRVYTLADAAAGGPIAPGDLLTTSDTPGHAMKVTDHAKAQGAIIGKAMGSLEAGRGTVLVLVSLQ